MFLCAVFTLAIHRSHRNQPINEVNWHDSSYTSNWAPVDNPLENAVEPLNNLAALSPTWINAETSPNTGISSCN